MLCLNVQKIEETASGCVAIQLLHMTNPSKVPMNKVNWQAKQDYEYVANYKVVLQTSFDRLKISKHIDVDKLIRGKYQDNLEFMQWFKRFVEVNGFPEDYDAVGARAKGKGAPGALTAKAPATKRRSQPSVPLNKNKENSSAASNRGSTSKPAAGKRATAPAAAPSAAMSTIKAELEALKATNDALEKERDFYFEKLRDVEVLLQLREESGKAIEGTADVFKILYASTEEDICVTDDGRVLQGDEAVNYKADGVQPAEAVEAAEAAPVADEEALPELVTA
ncbi:unnamed protein product [Chrysoparadoxa australica]